MITILKTLTGACYGLLESFWQSERESGLTLLLSSIKTRVMFFINVPNFFNHKKYIFTKIDLSIVMKIDSISFEMFTCIVDINKQELI